MSINIQQLIAHPESMDRDTLYELRTLLARYPYFQTARLLYVTNLYLLHDPDFGEELRKASLYLSDRKVLFQLVEGEHYALPKAVGRKKESEEHIDSDRTMSLIDAFLDSIPGESADKPVVKFDPCSDYASYLLQDDAPVSAEEENHRMPGQDLIEQFIEKADEGVKLIQIEKTATVPEPEEKPVPQPEPVAEEPEEEADDEQVVPVETEDEASCFTETLAKIYIKQQKYSKALEIIKKLSLNNPKKIAYFADQIRFLEKLIINAKNKE